MDFSEGLLDYLTKKSFFAQKAIKDFFRDTEGFGTFSERATDFSEGEFSSFGGFVLIPFRGSDGNRSAVVCCLLLSWN